MPLQNFQDSHSSLCVIWNGSAGSEVTGACAVQSVLALRCVRSPRRHRLPSTFLHLVSSQIQVIWVPLGPPASKDETTFVVAGRSRGQLQLRPSCSQPAGQVHRNFCDHLLFFEALRAAWQLAVQLEMLRLSDFRT